MQNCKIVRKKIDQNQIKFYIIWKFELSTRKNLWVSKAYTIQLLKINVIKNLIIS